MFCHVDQKEHRALFINMAKRGMMLLELSGGTKQSLALPVNYSHGASCKKAARHDRFGSDIYLSPGKSWREFVTL